MLFKAPGSFWPRGRGLVFIMALLAWRAQSQTISNVFVPVVTIQATDPLASWAGDPGTFTVFRGGPTNDALSVYYAIGGTASNGVDYASLTHWVTIPAGLRTNSITILPINAGQTNIENVAVKLVYSPMLPPVNYAIGFPAAATVFITPSGITNIPPTAMLSSPRDGEVFNSPGVVPLIGVAGDPDGSVTSMEFFAGPASLGVVTNWVVVDPPGPGGIFLPGMRAFFLAWTNPAPGAYELTAKATDNGGASAVSGPVHITVQTGFPPPTNSPALVRITSPPNGATFRGPLNLPIYAYTRDANSSVTNVEFLADTNDLGAGVPLCLSAPPGATWPPFCSSNLFVFVWSNAPVGSFVLSAVAMDSLGVSATSAPVKITVLSAPPPPTNRPPIVSLVATDPLAIEGTNCWPWLGLGAIQPSWSNWMSGVSTWRYFTNCGPKNATFAVRRFGDTNEDLTVGYEVGGTATNGVDYVPLSGSVLIPAGERMAQVTLIPLDDGPPDINSTVVLRLLASTNYILGFPRAAAALILDSGAPHPRIEMLSGNTFHLSSSGPDGAWFHVDYSTDLTNWTPLCTNQVVGGLIEFVDPDAGTNHSRFYRTVPELAPPGN